MKPPSLARFVSAAVLGIASLLAAPANASPFSNLYVFGDSVSDSGNVALAIGQPSGVPQVVTGNDYIPGLPYFPSGTFSNGAVWTEDFASMLGLSAAPSLAGGTNFAFGGARTAGPDVPVPTLTTQAGMFLAALHGAASSDALYVIAEVGNDARDALAAIASGANPALTIQATALQYAGDVGSIIDNLRNAGAQNFLVLDNVNLGVTPVISSMGGAASGLATALASAMNGALAARLQGEAGVTLFDAFSFLSGVVQNPGAFGFSNATDACGAIAGADCSQYVFWDGLHPTAAMHRVIAQAVYAAVVPEPETYALMLAGLLVMVIGVRRMKK